MMTAANPVILLNELLDDELNSPFRFIEVAMPYIEPELQQLISPLKKCLEARHARSHELIERILQDDGAPVAYRFQEEEQYLAFLSLKYLLPKLVEWKNGTILLHERALAMLDDSSDLREMIARHLEQHRAELKSISTK